MQKGDVIRARFLTMPDPFPGSGKAENSTPCARQRWCMCIQRGDTSWRSARASVKHFSRRTWKHKKEDTM